MSVTSTMSLVDVDKVVPVFDDNQELKEAVCDALVNMVHARTGGLGDEGETVFTVYPGSWFVSDFLQNRFDAAGRDRSSDIRIAVHGAEFKIRRGVEGKLKVQPSLAVYVREMPSWADLENEALNLRPAPRLKADVRKSIFSDARDRVKKAVAAGETRHRRDLLADFSREAMHKYGIKIEGKRPILATAQANETGASDSEGTVEAQDGSHIGLVESLGPNDEIPDHLCVNEKMPLKWRRLRVDAPSLVLNLTGDESGFDATVGQYSMDLKAAIEAAYRDYLRSPSGMDWAWRPRTVSPNAFRDKARWDQVLLDVRAKAPEFGRLYPGQKPLLRLDWTADPLDPAIVSVRIALEHVSGDDLKGDAEPGLFQVSMLVELPDAALVPFSLERVKPSYAIAGYMDVDASGVNCGVVSRSGERTVSLRTTWAPRYHLPRIVPNDLGNFDVSYRSLADDTRPVLTLSRLPDDFAEWIRRTAADVDPYRGIDAGDVEAHEREIGHRSR